MGTTKTHSFSPARTDMRSLSESRGAHRAQTAVDLEGAAAPDLGKWEPSGSRNAPESTIPPPRTAAHIPTVPPAFAKPVANDAAGSVLSKYFRDLAFHPVLSASDEMDAARAVEEAEIAHWIALLSLASAAEYILASLEHSVIEAGEDEVKAPQIPSMVRLARRWAKGGKLVRSQRRQYDELSRSLAEAVRLPDSDRVWMTNARQIAHELVSDQGPDNDTAWPSRTTRKSNDDEGPSPWRSKPAVALTDDYQAYLDRVEKSYLAQQEAKNRFVRANLRLVVTLARRYDRGQLPFIDLIQEGNLGLIKAVEQFDPRRGYRFSTYASWWIRHALGRGVADRGRAVRLPVHVLDAHNRAERHRQALLARNGREPTVDELAHSTGMPIEKLKMLEEVRADTPLSLDRPLGNEDDRRPIDVLQDADAPSPFDEVAGRAWSEQVPRLLAALSPVESRILRLRFGLDDGDEQTLQEIGDKCHVSRERIRQLQARALEKLRKQMRHAASSDEA